MTERQWVVDRTWFVTADTATEAMKATAEGDPDQIRVSEVKPNRWGSWDNEPEGER